MTIYRQSLLARIWKPAIHCIQGLGWLTVFGAALFATTTTDMGSFAQFIAPLILLLSIVLGVAVHFTCKELIGAIRDGEGWIARSILVAMIAGEFGIYAWLVFSVPG